MICMADYEKEAAELIAQDKKHLWHHITQHKNFVQQEPPIFIEGKGCMVKDVHGREFLDAVAGGVWCVNAGYGQESIAEAICAQLKKLPYYSGSAGTPPTIQLADKLAELLPRLQHAYFSCSGSEANEKAFKLVRQYNRLKYPAKNKYKILFRERDYHGTTLGALSATGQNERTQGYGPFVPGFSAIPAAYCYRCPYGRCYPDCGIACAHALEKIIQQEGPDTVGALILEPITAGGGIIVPVKEYFTIIQEICHKYEVLLIIDEVVTGFGRTGKAFGHQHWDVQPDMVTVAKGITSAYAPLSATLTTQTIFEAFLNAPDRVLDYFRDITTFGGSAGACAGALENIRIFEDEKLFANSAKVGQYLKDRLEELTDLPMVGDVRGKGLFLGVEIVKDKKTKEPVAEGYMAAVVSNIAGQGVLIGRMNRSVSGQNNVLEIAPALVLKKLEADRIAAAVRQALETVRL